MPYQGPLNKNNALSQVFTLNIEVTPTSLTTTPPLFKKIYKQLTLAAHYPNPPAIVPNLYLALALYLANTIYKDKVLTNALQEPYPNYLQKEGSRVKSLSRTALPQDLIKCFRCYKL